jgi:hypothetical protein
MLISTCKHTMKKLCDKFAATPQAAREAAARGKRFSGGQRLLTTVSNGAFAWQSITVRPSAPAATRWIE